MKAAADRRCLRANPFVFGNLCLSALFHPAASRSVACFGQLVLLKEQRDAPYCRYGNEHVNYPAEHGGLTSEEESDKVKLEEPDQSPVEAADNKQKKCYLVKHFSRSFPRTPKRPVFASRFLRLTQLL